MEVFEALFGWARPGAPMMRDQLIEAWHTNNRINLLLLEHISDAGLGCTLSSRGGRDVARQFAHLQDVRFWHLESRAKDLSVGLKKFARKGSKESPAREDLIAALTASGDAVATFLGEAYDELPKRQPFKKGVVSTLSYFISHEGHHRGNILLTLKQSGHDLPKEIRYRIWDWDRI